MIDANLLKIRNQQGFLLFFVAVPAAMAVITGGLKMAIWDIILTGGIVSMAVVFLIRYFTNQKRCSSCESCSRCPGNVKNLK